MVEAQRSQWPCGGSCLILILMFDLTKSENLVVLGRLLLWCCRSASDFNLLNLKRVSSWQERRRWNASSSYELWKNVVRPAPEPTEWENTEQVDPRVWLFTYRHYNMCLILLLDEMNIEIWETHTFLLDKKKSIRGASLTGHAHCI